MILFNPTDKAITVTIFGTEYTIKDKGVLEVDDAVGSYWKTKLHQFLLVQEVKAKVEKTVAEVESPKKK